MLSHPEEETCLRHSVCQSAVQGKSCVMPLPPPVLYSVSYVVASEPLRPLSTFITWWHYHFLAGVGPWMPIGAISFSSHQCIFPSPGPLLYFAICMFSDTILHLNVSQYLGILYIHFSYKLVLLHTPYRSALHFDFDRFACFEMPSHNIMCG